MIYEIVIEKGIIKDHKNDDAEFQADGLQLVNFLLSLDYPNGYSHRDLDAIQEYYDKSKDYACWNYPENEFPNDPETNYAKITIDGETRYYEEW